MPPPSPVPGLLAFVLFTFASSWFPASLLKITPLGDGRPLVTRLLACCFFYALSMGWQPLAAVWFVRRHVDPPGYLDHGLKPARSVHLGLAALAPLALALGAMLLAFCLARLGAGRLTSPPPLETLDASPSWLGGVSLMLAFLCALALIWAQALAEEIGFRGYLMTRLMQLCGAWKGLLLHGVVWGLWYTPLFLFFNQTLSAGTLASAGFVLTCALLGTLLGWLRLASDSIVPSVVANAVLTLAAGLPFALQGLDTGLRGAAYGAPGWFLMALTILLLAGGPWRRFVRTPDATLRVSTLPRPKTFDRALH